MSESVPPSDVSSAPTPPDPEDPLTVPMDLTMTKDSRIDGSLTQEAIDPADILPEDPEEQNDLA